MRTVAASMIEFRGVTKGFDGVPVLQDVSCTVPDHTVAVIIGRSGSGKSTLLRLLAGLEEPDEGIILIDGRCMSRPGFCEHPSRRGIGMMFQSPALWPHMTVADHLRFVLEEHPEAEQEKRVNELLGLTGLKRLGNRYPNRLSMGEARRTSLARALVVHPRCLLLDEPLTSLDPDMKKSLLPLIKKTIRESGASTLYVTHDRSEAQWIGDIFFELSDGILCPLSSLEDQGEDQQSIRDLGP